VLAELVADAAVTAAILATTCCSFITTRGGAPTCARAHSRSKRQLVVDDRFSAGPHRARLGLQLASRVGFFRRALMRQGLGRREGVRL